MLDTDINLLNDHLDINFQDDIVATDTAVSHIQKRIDDDKIAASQSQVSKFRIFLVKVPLRKMQVETNKI